MDNNISCGIHNKFDIEVIRDGEIRQKAQAFNIVTNKLWDYLIGSNDAFGTYIQYGSGTGTPSASDTSLFTREGGAEVTEVSLDVDHARSVITRVCRITLGLSTAVGVTLTEVGMAGANSNGNLTTHAMLQDMNGNPISIEKTDTDIINIYATVYCHWSVDGENVNLYPKLALKDDSTYENVTYYFMQTLTGRYNYFRNNTFKVGCAMGNCIVSSSKTWSKSSNVAQKKLTFTAPRYTESEGNIGGITHLVTTNELAGLAIKCGAKSWNKYHVTGEAVGTGDGETTEFKTKIGLPENAVVKINGNRANGVTVKKIPTERIRLMRIDGDLSEDGNLVYAGSYVPKWKGTMYFYNPDYQDVGFVAIRAGHYYSWSDPVIYASNDLITWTQVNGTSSDSQYYPILEQYRHYKYFKIVIGESNDLNTNYADIPNNIIFNTAPAVGDVITIDYDTECIPKDADHVFDASITFTFGEYTE